MRRLSTRTFGLRLADRIDHGGAKIREALSLPMVPDILDTMDEHDAARFFLLFPYQLFKTLLGQLHLLRDHHVRGRPALWYSLTDKFAKDFADYKLNPLFDACPEMQALAPRRGTTPAPARPGPSGAPPSQHLINTTLNKVLAGGGSHRLLSAGAEPDRTGKSACDIYRDETHEYEAGWCAQISNRRGSYPDDFTEIDMTTGLTAGTDAANLWAEMDQRTWHWRCPACHRLHEPRFDIKDPATDERLGGLLYEKAFRPDGLPDAPAIAATLAYQCPRCRTRFPDTPGTRTAFNGTAEKPRGLYVAMNPSPTPRSFGWRAHGVALRPWLAMVIRFELAQLARARGDLEPLGKCVREEFADIWDPEKYFRPDQAARYQHVTPVYDPSPFGTRAHRLDADGKPLYAATPYAMLEPWRGEICDPSGRPWRFATVDVQLDHFYLVIRKWGHWSQSRLHYVAKCLSPAEIAVICEREAVPPERVFFDTRHDAERVRTFCARKGWRTLMGDKEMRSYTHDDGIRRIYDKPKAIDAFTGTVHQGATESCVIETLFSKNAALDRLHLLRDAESKSPEDGTPIWTAASDAPDWYFKQLNAHFRKRVDRPDGSHHFVWHGQKDDHAADCEAMGIVCATMAELTGRESLGTPDNAEATNPSPA